MAVLRSMAALLAGRWQIPVALIALAALGLALLRARPEPRPVPFDQVMADIRLMIEAEAWVDAADSAANLLERDPPLTPAQQAELHDLLAEIIFEQESIAADPNLDNLQQLLHHDRKAMSLGQPKTVARLTRMGAAYEWLGQRERAIHTYRELVDEHDPPPGPRRMALQALVRLLEGVPESRAERRSRLTALLGDDGISGSYVWWGLQYAMQEAFDQGDIGGAREVLERYGERFKRSDRRGYYEYLQAWLLIEDGRFSEALPHVDWVRQWLVDNGGTDAELDRHGYLPGMNSWLKGRIELAEGRPQEALHSFERAIELQPLGPGFVNATLGIARAMEMLRRDEAARQVVREAVKRLRNAPLARRVGLPRIREGMLALYRNRMQAEDYDNAAGYLQVALDLIDEEKSEEHLGFLERLAYVNRQAAESATDPQRRATYHRRAARAFEQAAEIADRDDADVSTLLWNSAQEYDQGGLLSDARRILARFVERSPEDPRLPPALLQLGQAYEADGELAEAVKWYRLLQREFPRTIESQRSLLLTAGCLLAQGRDHYPEAKQVLLKLLEEEKIRPEATVFRDALFALCDLLYQQAEYAHMINRAEDFLSLYPDFREAYRVRFMLADGYRRSAYRLRELAPDAPMPEQTRRESRERFRRAAELFHAFLRSPTDARVVEGDSAYEIYRKLALFYRGDCLFELNEPETRQEALLTYQAAAAQYQNDPAALIAQVQIANVYLREGKRVEAARAVERARWLLRSISDPAFADGVQPADRAYWERYLRTVASSQLFRDVFAAAP